MSWSLYRWTWVLESPLHIGMSPAGSLNRCRLYIPAKAIRGALTAQLSRANNTARTDQPMSPDMRNFPAYREIARKLIQQACSTYLYPAEEDDHGWHAWLPHYRKDLGLTWRREEDANENDVLSDRQMRMRLLTTIPGTAIDPATDVAADATRRELECINTHWRAKDGSAGSPTAMVGYVFVNRDSNLIDELAEKIRSVFVGGDTRYGLGRLSRTSFQEQQTLFGYKVQLEDKLPIVHSKIVYAHTLAARDVLIGNRELMGGWNLARRKGLLLHKNKPLWAPGSTVEETNGTDHKGRVHHKWRIQRYGIWKLVGEKSPPT